MERNKITLLPSGKMIEFSTELTNVDLGLIQLLEEKLQNDITPRGKVRINITVETRDLLEYNEVKTMSVTS